MVCRLLFFTVIEPGYTWRNDALEDSDVLEVSTPHLDDVVRLVDNYGRAVVHKLLFFMLGLIPCESTFNCITSTANTILRCNQLTDAPCCRLNDFISH